MSILQNFRKAHSATEENTTHCRDEIPEVQEPKTSLLSSSQTVLYVR